MTDQITIPRDTLNRLLDAWDLTVLPTFRDGMMQERMEDLRAELAKPVELVEPITLDQFRAIANRTATTYRHRSDPEKSSYAFVDGSSLDDFWRKVREAIQPTYAWHDAPDVAALKSEIERLKELADSEGTRAVEYLRLARKAKAEIEQLRKDAERLDYIEESGNFGVTRYRSGPGGPVLIEAEDGKKDISKSASSLRDAIDSVIKEAK